MSETKITLPSGAQITETDLKTIEKKNTRENVKTILMAVGVVSLYCFVKARVFDNQIEETD